MINFVIWITAGAFIGWLAGVIMQANNRQGLMANIVVGTLGMLAGGYFLNPLFKIGAMNDGNFSIPAFLVLSGCAVILLVTFRLFLNIGRFLQRSRILMNSEHF